MFDAGLTVPVQLRTAVFTIRPLTPIHVEMDYAALMDSRNQLRLWSGSAWPQDDFTVADNLTDLQWHDEEHRDQIAFTYTVLNPAETKCLGCIYIKSLTAFAPYTSGELDELPPGTAVTRFWVRTSPHMATQETELLTTLRRWFQTTWHLPPMLYHTHQAHTSQIHTFTQTGLQPLFTLSLPDRGGKHIFWR